MVSDLWISAHAKKDVITYALNSNNHQLLVTNLAQQGYFFGPIEVNLSLGKSTTIGFTTKLITSFLTAMFVQP
jgi:hypothetical protein